MQLESTWIGKRKNPPELFQDVFWPRDLLPQKFPQARITTWGYNVQFENIFSSGSQATIFQHSQTLLSDITMFRGSVSDRTKPILFLAHGLGGIVVKDALSLSKDDLTHLKDIFPATTGVIFFGTPHHGSKVASLGKTALGISRVLSPSANTKIIRGLERNSEILERITRSFGQVLASGHLKVHSFREALDTHGIPIVDLSSYSIGYLHETTGTLQANHRDMAKFRSLNDTNFQRVTSVIQRWLEDGSTHRPQTLPQGSPSLPDDLIFDEEYSKYLSLLDSSERRSRIHSVGEAYGETYGWVFDRSLTFGD